MSFMERVIYGPQFGWRIETTHGTELIPDDVQPLPEGYDIKLGEVYTDEDSEDANSMCALLADYCEGTIESIELVHGFFGRYSAPGYMDCTPWSFDTDEAALIAELDEMYGDDTCPDCDCDPCECDDETEE